VSDKQTQWKQLVQLGYTVEHSKQWHCHIPNCISLQSKGNWCIHCVLQ